MQVTSPIPAFVEGLGSYSQVAMFPRTDGTLEKQQYLPGGGWEL